MRRAAYIALLLSGAAFAALRLADRSAPCRPDRSDRLCLTDTSLFRTVQSVALSQQCAGNPLTGTRGEPITFARTSAATCRKSDGEFVTLASGQPRLQAGGYFGENSTTNLLLQSDDVNNAAWTKDLVTITDNAASFYGGSLVMDLVTQTTGASNSAYQSSTVASSTGPFTYSSWVATDSGSASRSVVVGCLGSTPATCTCGRDDGGACTTGTTGTNCGAYMVATTTPVRLWATATCTAAVTSVLGANIPNQYPGGTGTGAGLYGRSQLEAKAAPTSSIVSAGTAVTRNGDTAGFATPAGMSLTEGCSKICVTPTWTGVPPEAATRLFLYGNAALTTRFLYAPASASTALAYAGAATPGVTANYTIGVQRCYTTDWSAAGNFLRVTRKEDGVSNSSAFTGFPSFDANLNVGTGTSAPGADVSWVLGPGPGRCQ